MMKELRITIGVEVDTDEARRRVEREMGESYAESMTDKECLEYYADSEYGNGLGCEVEVL